jgi:hypothetical protein
MPIDETITTKPQRKRILLPDGDHLYPREQFAAEVLGVSDKTAKRYNLPTVYIGGSPFVKHNAALQQLAGGARRLNQPAKRR